MKHKSNKLSTLNTYTAVVIITEEGVSSVQAYDKIWNAFNLSLNKGSLELLSVFPVGQGISEYEFSMTLPIEGEDERDAINRVRFKLGLNSSYNVKIED